MFWKRNVDECPEFNRHFAWAEYTQMPEPWEGRVKATTGPIDKAVKAQGKELAGQNTIVKNSLEMIEESLDTVN